MPATPRKGRRPGVVLLCPWPGLLERLWFVAPFVFTPMKIVCPQCGHTLKAPDGWTGRAGCPKCHHRWEVPVEEERPPDPAPSPPEPIPPPTSPVLSPVVFTPASGESVAPTPPPKPAPLTPFDFEPVAADAEPSDPAKGERRRGRDAEALDEEEGPRGGRKRTRRDEDEENWEDEEDDWPARRKRRRHRDGPATPPDACGITGVVLSSVGLFFVLSSWIVVAFLGIIGAALGLGGLITSGFSKNSTLRMTGLVLGAVAVGLGLIVLMFLARVIAEGSRF